MALETLTFRGQATEIQPGRTWVYRADGDPGGHIEATLNVIPELRTVRVDVIVLTRQPNMCVCREQRTYTDTPIGFSLKLKKFCACGPGGHWIQLKFRSANSNEP